ncbi:thermosome subunit, partial [Candidatus Woesearchaeota archaeon]|nr:thermosome subunit [Candidatus Woesearchaeota archaeon]
MKSEKNYQPIFVVPESSSRTEGKDAQRMNIQAAKLVADTVRTTLGPKGMDKMLVDSMGSITVTNDGVTILNEIQVEHPTAKMIVEIAKTQENEVGDGTTTAVVLAGELLKRAEELLDSDIHATVIAKGYRMAAEKAKQILEGLSHELNGDDDKLLKIALTAMTGKGTDVAKDHLARTVVMALNKVTAGIPREKLNLDKIRESIKISKKTGASVDDTGLLQGIVLDKERV